MAAVTSPGQRVGNRAGDRGDPRHHVDLPRAALLDRLDRVQAAQRRHLGAADGLLHARDHAVHQALHQAGAADQAGGPGGLRGGALVGAAHLRRRRARAAGRARTCSSRSIRTGSSTA